MCSKTCSKLVINNGENKESTLYRVPNDSILHIYPGPSLLGKSIVLYCNYPENGESFERKKYNLLRWLCCKTGKPIAFIKDSDYTIIKNVDMYCEISLDRPGSYHYYFKFNKSIELDGSGYFCKDPIIQLGLYDNSITLQPDAVRCQTVLVKCLGQIDTWESKLRVAKESGYNMIHFTPIQMLGGSRSSYSISDQLKLNTAIGSDIENLQLFLSKLSNDWKMAFVCDIVLNHTANESQWLQEHPECSYNCKNSPHLRPAALLDFLLFKIGEDVSNGALEPYGIFENRFIENTLEILSKIIFEKYLPKLKLWEFYQLNVEVLSDKFQELLRNNTVRKYKKCDHNDLKIIQDTEFKRLSSTIDLEKAIAVFSIVKSNDNNYDKDDITESVNKFKQFIIGLNANIRDEIQSLLISAVDNVIAGVRYERVQENGPKYKIINEKYPLFPRYFTDFSKDVNTLEEAENVIFSEGGAFIMAHNGWVMNSDPLIDFAEFQSGFNNVYLRRELISWGDCIKLRYGEKPEDNPYLWNHMKNYVEQTVKIFHGVRLDNCHSTPLHVAEYLLDSARKINPNLYVMAELFTNSDEKDNIFVNRLGITSLIREAQSAWNSHEEGRLVYRYGGEPVGSFQKYDNILTPVIANALFMDLTHDNPSPISKRSVYDFIPTSALVSMACCGTGSNRGYDELVPHHIHVVNEEREYASWDETFCNTGIISAKKCLNELHGYLSEFGFSEVYVDQMTEHIVAVTRHNPKTHESIILVAYTCFQLPNNDWPFSTPNIRPLKFEGHFEEILFEIEFNENLNEPNSYSLDSKIINGLNNYKVDIKTNINIDKSGMLEDASTENNKQFNFRKFKPGSVLAIRVSLEEESKKSINEIKKSLNVIDDINSNEFIQISTLIKSMLEKINLNHCNEILFKSDKEERDNSDKGVYVIPNFGPLVYCGLQGFISILDDISKNNDLGHPMCSNLRDGNWMLDYIWQRMKTKNGLLAMKFWMKQLFDPLKYTPRYLVPKYFDRIVRSVYNLIKNHSLSLMSQFIQNGDTFIKHLGLSSLQFISVCPSAKLPPFSPNLHKVIDNNKCATLSAGLPHFATDYMRCWGRDTFISLRGLLLLTGRFDEALELILGFAACLRHGLIPNLLSGGYNARYNCRDAIWWWLECIKSYVNLVPDGSKILNYMVLRLYPQDDSEANQAEVDQPLYEVMQESLEKHFKGLRFRERNAGRQIDEHMTDKGFDNEIGVNMQTGFVFGGNEWNCGTWMDKMGSSAKACTKGIPATPRDGSAVEIVALSYSVITWLSECFENKIYPYEGVTNITGNDDEVIKWSFKEWSNKIKMNFEESFYIDKHDEYVNQLNIYKDTVGASKRWPDYQMRCNFPVAMAIAPDLFNTQNAWKALEKVKSILLGPLGMKTLDPSDWAYRPNYDNSNDSEDSAIAHGFNYHQGPEWLWPIGFYIRARLHFASKIQCLDDTLLEVRGLLSKHLTEIETNHWRGLPELTNENGSICTHSCATQAWSVATILEALYDIEEYEKCTEN